MVSGGTPRRETPAYWNGSLDWYSAKDLKSFLLKGSQDRITEQGASNGTRKVPKGTPLMLVRGMTLLKEVPVGITTSEASFNQDVRALLSDAIVGEYLGYLLKSRERTLLSMVDQAGHGTGRLSTDRINELVLHFPECKKEQVAIVSVLSMWDLCISQLTDLIAAKLGFKQGLMQQLLTGKKRITSRTHHRTPGPLPGDSPDDSVVSLEVEFGITGKSFQEGIPAVSTCPPGWTQHSFRQVFKAVERPAELSDQVVYQLVTAKRYRGGIVPREQLRGEQIKTKTQFFVAAGDFLISKRQIIHGACGMVPASLDGAVVSNEYACLQPSSQLDPGFLNYLTHARYFQQTCFHASVGVALEKMIFRLDQWLKHLVNLPPLSEQRAIAHCLSTMDREILLLARQRRLLKEQKKGLMQKLLTGEVRVHQK